MDDQAGPAERDRIDRDKAALRARLRALRDAIPAHERTRRSEEVAARVLGLPAVEGGGSVLLFYAFGSEVATRELIAAFADRDRTVLLPVVDGDRLLPMPYRPGDPLVRSALGVDEPVASPAAAADPGEIGLVIAPGLAFDRDGYRLGYGRGFYDRFLAGLPERAARVGIGFHEQLLERVPRGPRDQRLHLVVTDREVVVIRTP
jgi:5-formyltetrahydrofolate cyclo-ligase